MERSNILANRDLLSNKSAFDFIEKYILEFYTSRDEEIGKYDERLRIKTEMNKSFGLLIPLFKGLVIFFLLMVSLAALMKISSGGEKVIQGYSTLGIIIGGVFLYRFYSSKKSKFNREVFINEKYKIDNLTKNFIESKSYQEIEAVYNIVFKEKGYFLDDDIIIILENETELVDATYSRLTKDIEFEFSKEAFYGLVATWAVEHLKNKIRNDFDNISLENDEIVSRYITLFGHDEDYADIVGSTLQLEYNLRMKLKEKFDELRTEKKDTFLDDILKSGKYNRKQIIISDLDDMDGIEFENFLAVLFKKMGYKAEVTKGSGDQGVDLIVENLHDRYAVQAKRYSDKVSNTAIQEAYAGMSYYNCSKSMVVTTNYFTKGAIELAQKNHVELIDRNKLDELLKSHVVYQSDYEAVLDEI